MAMTCGCEIRGGQPVYLADLERHWEHTMECLLYWEIILGPASDPTVREKVAAARLAIGEFIEKRKASVDPVADALGMA